MSRRRDPLGVGAKRTVRQQLRGLLLREEIDFETLRAICSGSGCARSRTSCATSRRARVRRARGWS